MIVLTCQRCGRAIDGQAAFEAHVEEHYWRDAHPTLKTFTKDDEVFLRALKIADATTEATAA